MKKHVWIPLLAFVCCASIAVAEKATESSKILLTTPTDYFDDDPGTLDCVTCAEDPVEHAGQICGVSNTGIMCKCIAIGGSRNGQEVDARARDSENPEQCVPLYRQST